jgi:D-beta-D-heptose 7-phosphate kinase/D-beta-D-heptose 1-phosphate adenosyltransferase
MKVLLIGDSCEDRYFYGDVKRLNPEAPVPILEYKRGVTSKGMVWNVRENLKSFGVEVYTSTHPEQIIKTRFIDEKSNQQILRSDEEPEIQPLSFDFPSEWNNLYDALVISDYDKGFLTKEKIFELTSRFVGPVFIDSKKTNLPADAYIKVNELEYERMSYCNYENLIITRGGKGAEYKGDLYPAEKVNVFDVVGAGDTFLAALTYGYLKYGRIDKAIPLANRAAAVAVSHRGTYVLTEEDVKKILC